MAAFDPAIDSNRGTPLPPIGFFATVRAWLWLIIVGAIVGAVVSLAASLVTPPTYLGKVTLIVTPFSTATGLTFSDVEVTQALAPTFAELSTTTPVLQRVIADTKVDLDPEGLAKTVTTHVPAGTSLIDISVTHRDPDTAAALANAIAAELEQYQAHGADQISALRVSLAVVDPAVPPRVPEGLGIVFRTVLGGAVGLLLAISLAFFVENLGRGVQSVGRGVGAAGRPPPEPSEGVAVADTTPGRADRSIGSIPSADGRLRNSLYAQPAAPAETPLSQTMIRPVLSGPSPTAPRITITSQRGGAASYPPTTAPAPRPSAWPTAGSAMPASAVSPTPIATPGPITARAAGLAMPPASSASTPGRPTQPTPMRPPGPVDIPAPTRPPSAAAAAPATAATAAAVVSADAAPVPAVVVPAPKVVTGRPAVPLDDTATPPMPPPTPAPPEPAPRRRPARSAPRGSGSARAPVPPSGIVDASLAGKAADSSPAGPPSKATSPQARSKANGSKANRPNVVRQPKATEPRERAPRTARVEPDRPG